MNWSQLISNHFNVFLGCLTILATVIISAVTFIAGRVIVRQIRKYIVEAEEISKARELEHKRLEWKRDYVNDFIIEPLIEYLEEGTEIIDSLVSLYNSKKFVEEELESEGTKTEKKHYEQVGEHYERLVKHQHKSSMAETRAKFLEDSNLTEAIEKVTIYVARAGEAYEEDDIDGISDSLEKAEKNSLTALKRLSEHQEQVNSKVED